LLASYGSQPLQSIKGGVKGGANAAANSRSESLSRESFGSVWSPRYRQRSNGGISQRYRMASQSKRTRRPT